LGVDVEEFVSKLGLLEFRAKNVKQLRAILVLDCCRADLPNLKSRGGLSFLTQPQLNFDQYIVFSCEEGHTSAELEQHGGTLMRELLPSLKYEKNIVDIFHDACSRVKPQIRPSIYCRPSAHDIPVLGRKVGDPPGWTGMRHDFGDDRGKKKPKKVMMGYMSDSQVPYAAGVRGRGWYTHLKIADQLARSPSSRQVFLSSKGCHTDGLKRFEPI